MRQEIVPLTSLRGVAAMAVVAMHFSATMQENTTRSFPSLAPHAELAVDVFFVLSGFIMAYTYLPSFVAGQGSGPYWRFLVKRAARILPLNVAVSVFLFLAALSSSFVFGLNLFPHVKLDNWATDLVTNALMLPGVGIGISFNWPAWSISVEFAAYLLFPIFLACIFGSSRAVFVVSCLAASALLVGICLTNAQWSPDGLHNQPWPSPWRDLARCCSEFLLGLAVFRVYQSRRFGRFFETDWVALIICGAIVGLILTRKPDLFVLPFLPLLVLSLSLNNGWVARLMATRFLHFLGLISFSLYLVHDNFRSLAVLLIRHLHPAPLPPAMGMLLAACCTLLMIFPAWFSYVWVEKPGRKLIRSVADLRRVGASSRSAQLP